jgi:hypothetical protein
MASAHTSHIMTFCLFACFLLSLSLAITLLITASSNRHNRHDYESNYYEPTLTSDIKSFNSIIGPEYNKWPCQIPYNINDSIILPEEILNAINYITKMTKWSFIERTNESSYIDFINSNGCWSYLGKQNKRQEIGISQYCGFGAIVHEISHAIGLDHEQSRADRDDYVHVNYNNIISENKLNYNKKLTSNLGNYDYNSIMHYGQWDFSINDNIKTIIPKYDLNNTCYIGQRSKLSDTDILHLNTLIKDNSTCTTCNNCNITTTCHSNSIEICGPKSDTHGFLQLIFTEFKFDGISNNKNKYISLHPFNRKYFTIYYYNSLITKNYWVIDYDGSTYAYNYDDNIIGSSAWVVSNNNKWINKWDYDSAITISEKDCSLKTFTDSPAPIINSSRTNIVNYNIYFLLFLNLIVLF